MFGERERERGRHLEDATDSFLNSYRHQDDKSHAVIRSSWHSVTARSSILLSESASTSQREIGGD